MNCLYAGYIAFLLQVRDRLIGNAPVDANLEAAPARTEKIVDALTRPFTGGIRAAIVAA